MMAVNIDRLFFFLENGMVGKFAHSVCPELKGECANGIKTELLA
jgi:hypothetical protein